MEPEGSLPHLQMPTTSSCSESDQIPYSINTGTQINFIQEHVSITLSTVFTFSNLQLPLFIF
jgi:hypothetical protein